MAHDSVASYKEHIKKSRSSFNSQWTIDSLQIPNGPLIRYGIYKKNPEKINRFLIFLNGHAEYLERYDYLPQDLQLPENYGFLSWDHRAQGLSQGEPRLHFDDYKDPAKDAQYIIETLIGKETPYVIAAHSMGGLISLFSYLNGSIKPEKMILSSPLLGVIHPLPKIVLKSIAIGSIKLGLGTRNFQKNLQKKRVFENNLFTHSEERFANRYKASFYTEGVTCGWGYATFQALKYVSDPKNLSKISIPIKILLPDDDRVVDSEATRRWVEKAKKFTLSPLEIQEIPHTRHELFAEAKPSYDEVIKSCKQFLNL